VPKAAEDKAASTDATPVESSVDEKEVL